MEARGRKGGETGEGKEMRGVGGQVRASVGNRTQDLISIKIWFCQSWLRYTLNGLPTELPRTYLFVLNTIAAKLDDRPSRHPFDFNIPCKHLGAAAAA